MESIIARIVDSTDRIFPAITPSLYDATKTEASPTLEQAEAASLLTAPQEKLTAWQRYLSWTPDGATRVARALLLHRKAFESERAAQWRRADFFWQELYAELSPAFKNDDAWQSLAGLLATRNPGLKVLSDPLQLRARFITELLVDTHVAFYNGHAGEGDEFDLQSRAWTHLNYITNVCELSRLSSQDKLSLIGPAIEARMDLLASDHDWRKAIDSCSVLIHQDPESIKYQDKLVNLCFQYAVENSEPTSGPEGILRGIRFLESCIHHLNHIGKKYPYNLTAYQRLADLHELLATKLAKVGQLSSALVAARKATAFNPSSESAAKTILELAATMEDLKEKVSQIRPQLASQPSLRIRPATIMMLDETRLGFTPLGEFERSGEPQQTVEAFSMAKARTLWQRIGLDEPPDRWNERAQKLSMALDSLVAKAPASASELLVTWRQVAAADQDLEQCDHEAVCRFIENELWHHGQESPQNAAELTDYVPLLLCSPSRPKQLREPFYYWVQSRKDMRPKFQALVAIIVLAAVGLVAIKDTRARSIRAKSYQQIVQASNSRDYLQVVEGAEAFLSHPMVVGSDTRDEEVLRRYNEALVRWVARRPDVLQPAVVVHLERYRQLTGKRN